MSGYTLGEILLTDRDIQRRIRELGLRISQDYAGLDLILVGVLKGVVVFMADLARAISIPHTFDFIGASSYGDDTKSSGQVLITRDVSANLKGKHVLLLDDIYDTGKTLEVLKGLLELHHPASIKTCTFIAKQRQREKEMALDYVGFEVPDLFVVGYGLDYAEQYRHLRHLATLVPED